MSAGTIYGGSFSYLDILLRFGFTKNDFLIEFVISKEIKYPKSRKNLCGSGGYFLLSLQIWKSRDKRNNESTKIILDILLLANLVISYVYSANYQQRKNRIKNSNFCLLFLFPLYTLSIYWRISFSSEEMAIGGFWKTNGQDLENCLWWDLWYILWIFLLLNRQSAMAGKESYHTAEWSDSVNGENNGCCSR